MKCSPVHVITSCTCILYTKKYQGDRELARYSKTIAMVDEYWMSAWTPLSNWKGWVCSLTDAEDFLNVYRSIKGHFIGDRKSPNFGLHEVFNDALAQRSPSEIEAELAEAEKSILPDQPACDTEESTPAREPLMKPVKARPKWIVRPRIQVGPQKGASDRSKC